MQSSNIKPNKMVKFKSENLPFDVFLWLQLLAKQENDTKMRLTVKADLNPIMESMVSKPLKQAVDQVADLLSNSLTIKSKKPNLHSFFRLMFSYSESRLSE